MITLELLQGMFPKTKNSVLESYVDPLNEVCDKFEINTSERLAMFLAQIGHESGGLSVVQENLNYRAERLAVVFPKYFKGIDTSEYAHNPEKIANRVYANRMGNGDEESGDGYKFRGRGLIQLTGHNNYASFASDMGMDIDEAVEYLSTPEGAAMSAGWYWNKTSLNQWADSSDVLTVTKKINGGTIGLAEREHLFHQGMNLLG
jgi:putative chitinase